LLATLQRIGTDLDGVLSSLDPSLLHPADAVKLLDAAVAIEARASAVKTLVADRAADAAEWARLGYRSPEEWLAASTGVGYGEARRTLDASAKLPELPVVSAALRRGELSGPKLAEIAPAATPENEGRLIGAASRQGLRQLKETCATEKASARTAEQEAARAARVHKARHHRSWTDSDGAYCYAGSTTAAIGACMEAAIAAEADAVFKEAYAEGRRESAAAYRADALARLVAGGGDTGGTTIGTTVVIRVDQTRLAGGEGLCEAVGVGPIPIDDAIGAILGRAFIKVVLHDGVDISAVSHPGRRRPAVLESAIFERDEYRCVRSGCGSRQNLQVHHYRRDYAKQGPTAYWNLATLCRFDHDLVTYGGHRLEGGPGDWKWIEPP
jgi:hypothetical protein